MTIYFHNDGEVDEGGCNDDHDNGDDGEGDGRA